MTNVSGLAYILLAGAIAFSVLTLRHLHGPKPRHHRWHHMNDLIRDGGMAVLFLVFASLFAAVMPNVVGIAIALVSLVAWLTVTSYTSRKASQEGRAFVDAIMSGKYDQGGS